MSACKNGKCKKMLVAVDGSLSSMHALTESFKLATSEKSWITVTSVVPPYEGDLDLMAFGNVQHAMKQPCERALAEAAAIAKAERALIKIVCEEGDPYERIIDLAEAENSDLIVMGRRGLNKVERAMMGSVSARVIGYSQKDVLIVPHDAPVNWKNVLVATDRSRYSSIAIERAIDFADSYGGSLKILSVIDIPSEFYGEAPKVMDALIEEARRHVVEAERQAEASGVRAETFVREGDAHEEILNFAQRCNASMIVMGSHGRTGLKRLLMGSVTEKVIGSACCPVLVVRF